MRYRSLGLATVLIVTSTAWAQTPSDNQHALIGPPQLHALPVTAPTLVEAYGPDPLQIGELRLPAGPDPFPVVMVIHGGCWTKGYEGSVHRTDPDIRSHDCHPRRWPSLLLR